MDHPTVRCGCMKTVILAGGLGTRISEESEARPKPLIEIGGEPILWHILKHYAHFGHKEFVIALGYKGELIKRYFLDRLHLDGSLTLTLKDRSLVRHSEHREDWVLHLMETGLHTITGGRLKRLRPILGCEPFMLTYGDGV